jgi:outer membrane protein
MQQSLIQEFNGPNEEVKKLQSDIKFNIEKFQRESMTMSDEQKQELQTKIEGLQQSYQAKAQPLQQQMRQRQAEEQNKIFTLIQQSISSVAAEEKIDIVLEARSIVFLAEGQKDISELVVKKLSK